MASRRFVYVKYTDGTPMVTHLNEINSIMDLLNQMNKCLSDELHTPPILVTLPDSWVPVSLSFSNSTTNRKLTIKSMTPKLLEEVRRQKSWMTFSTVETMATLDGAGMGVIKAMTIEVVIAVASCGM